jgi:hypothetical protein
MKIIWGKILTVVMEKEIHFNAIINIFKMINV